MRFARPAQQHYLDAPQNTNYYSLALFELNAGKTQLFPVAATG
jgi:hypothetical protein